MIGLLLVAHGQMAEGLMDAMSLIVGKQDQIAALALQEMDAIEALEEKIEQQVQALNTGQGVLIFVDLFGASPFNASARVAVRYENVDVITGMNLPMLLETTLNRESSSLQDLIATATDAGTSGVRVLKQLLKDQTDG